MGKFLPENLSTFRRTSVQRGASSRAGGEIAANYQVRLGAQTRQILSTLIMTYDPLELLANFLMFLKMLLQEVWRSRVDWDEQFKKQERWLRVLPHVEYVRVPRCYRLKTSIRQQNIIQLHAFIDASENGYAIADK